MKEGKKPNEQIQKDSIKKHPDTFLKIDWQKLLKYSDFKRRVEMEQAKVYPRILYLKIKSALQAIPLLISIFLPLLFIILYPIDSDDIWLVILLWVIFIVAAIMNVDIINRLVLFPENDKKYSLLFILYIAALIVVLSIFLAWFITWQIRTLPFIENYWLGNPNL